MVKTGIILNNMESASPECYMIFLRMVIYSNNLHWSDITRTCNIVTEMDLITEIEF